MQIRQHIPDFIIGIAPQMAEFSTVEQLVEIPWVAQWSDDNVFKTVGGGTPVGPRIPFCRYSISPAWGGLLLMAEMDGGRKWFVVGTITGADAVALDLPDWQPARGIQAPRDRNRMAEKAGV